MHPGKPCCHSFIRQEQAKVVALGRTAPRAEAVLGTGFYQQSSEFGERAHSARGTLFAGTSRMSVVAVCQDRSTDISV